ncbi:DNA oxidative demethylase AlkB [Chromatiaceae bacterium AAb-1]|nr:DNA oxidative demethylase AlkB [Chromatiaceae bacterium AAb-1]
MTPDLFSSQQHSGRYPLAEQTMILPGFALPLAETLLAETSRIAALSPPRHMVTPGGHIMSVAITCCGTAGWITDHHGYRYSKTDPLTAKPWPDMPVSFRQLATDAALAAGFPDFIPDVCLINYYKPGARMSLHQDKDEQHLTAPIVSVSLGMAATFLFGGLLRTDKAIKAQLLHGDVVVWGGCDRLRYHGILPLQSNPHPVLGPLRINLTFRQAF